MKRILIVDDDREIVLALQVRPKANGYSVSASSDVIEGASLDRAFQLDLILLDILMPGGNGFLLAKTFHRMLATKETPIISYDRAQEPGTPGEGHGPGSRWLCSKNLSTPKSCATALRVS